jgi:MarR family 2-MHQ and catechol resistance regulon transcriptional repressor
MSKAPRELVKEPGIRLAMGIHRAHRALVAHAEAFGAEQGLEVIHLSILHSLGLGGPKNMGKLAKSVVMNAPDLTRRAKQLEDRGLVVRERSKESQREVVIALTPEGEAMFGRSFRHLHSSHSDWFGARLSKAEQQVLGKLLTQLEVATEPAPPR